MMICSVLPISFLSEFVDLTKMDDDEIEEFMARRTVRNSAGLSPNAIVSCGDMHREDDDDVENPFLFTGRPNPTNVILPSSRNKTLGAGRGSLRKKRQTPPTPPTPPDPIDPPPPGPDLPLPDPGLNPAVTTISPADRSEQAKQKKVQNKLNKIQSKTFRDYFNPDKYERITSLLRIIVNNLSG
jgi:hypothetical protein